MPDTKVTKVEFTFENLGSYDLDGRLITDRVGPHKLTWLSPPQTGVFFLVGIDPVVSEKEHIDGNEVA
jgi:hypothetical protein